MADKTKIETPKRGIRWKRIFGTLLFLGLAGGGLYAASWFNAQRYFMIVEATEVRIAKGRMLPVGHEPFIPLQPELRRAYETFPLPSGMNVPRGETTFSDRVELDQALFRILKDSIAFSLSEDNRRTPELVSRYLKQIKAIPGTSPSQQLDLSALERDAAYQEARQRMNDGIATLKESSRLFRESAKGQGSRAHDGEWRARQIDTVIEKLAEASAGAPPDALRDSVPPPKPIPQAQPNAVRTATAATSTRAR